MSLSKTGSPIRKVIFLQKIFRFASRTPKDLIIINSVCKDFEGTMQAHHTFNLVLYDNVIKQRQDEKKFLFRSVTFLTTAPAWIVYQWTIINEHDEIQRELLKVLLFEQAKIGNKILIREPSLVNDENPSTTRELFRHVLDSCAKLGIAKKVLDTCGYYWNCIIHAVSRKISADCLALLIESCVQHGLDVKRMLHSLQRTRQGWNCIMVACACQLPIDSLALLIELCTKHGVDMKMMLEENDRDGHNCFLLAVKNQLPVASFKLLIESCVQHGLDVKRTLEQRDENGFDTSRGMNCILLAAPS